MRPGPPAERQIPCGNDRKKSKGKGKASRASYGVLQISEDPPCGIRGADEDVPAGRRYRDGSRALTGLSWWSRA